MRKFGGKGKLSNLAFYRTITRCIAKEGFLKVTKGLLWQVIRTSNYKSCHRPSTFSLEIAERGGFIRCGWVGFGVLKLTCDQAVLLPRKRKKPDRRLM